MPVVEHAAGIEDVGEAAARQLGGGGPCVDRTKRPRPSGNVSVKRRGVPGWSASGRATGCRLRDRGARARCRPSTARPTPSRRRSPRGSEVEAARWPAEQLRDARRHVADDLPVGAAVAAGGIGLADALHAALGVRERAVLLGERRRRQHDVGELRRLRHEDVLHDEELSLSIASLRVGQVGSLSIGFSPMMYMQSRWPAAASSIISVAVSPGADGQLGAPGAANSRDDLGVGALQAGKLVRQAARVAAPLHVVLAAQRRDAGARSCRPAP